MSGIHDAVMLYTAAYLTEALVTVPLAADPDDVAAAGAVVRGPLQGDPDPDEARISIDIYENDPDSFEGSGTRGLWVDEVYEVECGGAVTWSRKFTVKARCLLETTKENLNEGRSIASTVKERIETAILRNLYSGVQSGDEYVSRGPLADSISTEMLQAGGPPDAYDFHIKVRFELLTTRTGVFQ